MLARYARQICVSKYTAVVARHLYPTGVYIEVPKHHYLMGVYTEVPGHHYPIGVYTKVPGYLSTGTMSHSEKRN